MKSKVCQGCPLADVGEGYCYGEGPEEATVLLLGEALGAEEARQARPFVGGAGRVLNMLLGKAGVKRSRLYVTNVVRCRPPGNRTPTEKEIRECGQRHNLHSLLTKFNLVVPMGNVALYAVAGETHITRWRGSVFQKTYGDKRVKVLPTLHPAAVMRQQEFIPAVVHDFSKINQEGWTDEYLEPKQDYELHAYTGHLLPMAQRREFAFDVETRSLEPYRGSVTLLGLSCEAGKAVVLDDLVASQTQLEALFASHRLKIGHNVAFDMAHMEANGFPVSPPWYDTMIAHHLLLSDTPKDLGFVASLYTRIPYWKHLMKQDLRLYNATDADATYRIYEATAPELEAKGLKPVFDTSMALIPIFSRMTQRGVRVDMKLQKKWRVGLEKKIEQLDTALKRGLDDQLFNWRSHKQLVKLLYIKLGLPRQYSKYGKSLTANEEALTELHKLTGSKIVEALLKLRKLSKLSSTYFASERPRVHSEYLLHGTATGRLSSRNPNLQNVPKGPAREIYLPEEGHVFISADYNQIELRIAALLAEEKELLAAFGRGEDIHRTVASTVYKVPQAAVTDLQRFRAKFIVYGLGYGRGARSLAKAYGMTVAEAERFIYEYFNAFGRIKLWREDLVEEVRKTGYLANPFGRRRYFFGPSIIPKVYNFPPQSTAADVILRAMVKIDEQLPKGSWLAIQVHDEVVVQAPEDNVRQVGECLRDVMQAPVPELGGYQFPVDVKVGKTWREVE